MMKRLGRAYQRWGYYGLAMLCVGVIVFSALWTGRIRERAPGAQVISDESQRLSQAVQERAALTPPCQGALVRGYSEEPVYFAALGLWQPHLALDFSAEAGTDVFAMAAGQAQVQPDGLYLLHEDGKISVYRGLARVMVTGGQRVRAGEVIGQAGGSVAFEGTGHVCIALIEDGKSIDFSGAL